MYFCVFICVHVSVFVCVCKYVFVYLHVHMCLHIYACLCFHISVCVFMRVCAYGFVCVFCIFVCVHMCGFKLQVQYSDFSVLILIKPDMRLSSLWASSQSMNTQYIQMKHEHKVCKKRNNIRNWNFKATSIKKRIFLKFKVWFVCILF